MWTTNKARIILVFNPLKRFIGVFTSATQIAKILGVTKSSIRSVCIGKSMTAKNLYFRYLPNDLSIEDIAGIDLPTFDKMNGIERKLYATKQITRKGMKYKKRQ